VIVCAVTVVAPTFNVCDLENVAYCSCHLSVSTRGGQGRIAAVGPIAWARIRLVSALACNSAARSLVCKLAHPHLVRGKFRKPASMASVSVRIFRIGATPPSSRASSADRL
jgi:hypothetical protein